MREKQISIALLQISEGFKTLSEAFSLAEEPKQGVEVSEIASKVAKAVTPKEEPKKETKVEPVKEVKPVQEEVAEEVAEESGYTKESLDKLSYNEIKALAKENGVKATGSKSSIIAKLLEVFSTVAEEEETEIEEDKNVKKGKIAEEKEEVVEEDDINEDVEGDDEETEKDNTLYDRVVADLEGYSDEELADILSDIGISPKGKRQALLSKIVQAIEEEKLEWADEGAEDEETTEVDEDTTANEEGGEEEEEEFDFVTEARKTACLELEDEIRADFKKKKITPKSILKFLKEYNEEYVSQGTQDDLENYIYVHFMLIDEDGELHELADPYYLGDDTMCCGEVLKEVDEDLVCEICGTSYEK